MVTEKEGVLRPSHLTFAFLTQRHPRPNSSNLSLPYSTSQEGKGPAHHSSGIDLHLVSGLSHWWAALCWFGACKRLGVREWDKVENSHQENFFYFQSDLGSGFLERKAQVGMAGMGL